MATLPVEVLSTVQGPLGPEPLKTLATRAYRALLIAQLEVFKAMEAKSDNQAPSVDQLIRPVYSDMTPHLKTWLLSSHFNS